MGAVVFSVDAELGWGFHDLPDPPTRRVEAGREGWLTLLDIFDRYDVPATWAVVGHLMLDSCDGVHADHPAIDGWFDRERTSWRDRPDLRFGTDLVRQTVGGGHEIACHTFSHVRFGDPRITPEIAAAELAAASDAAERFGVEYDSIVFPRNAVGHRDRVADAGFTCYRSREPAPATGAGRAAAKLRDALTARPSMVEPTVDEYGLVNVPPSLFLFGFEGRARTVATALGGDPIRRQARNGIDRAAETDGVFHMWLHPNNLCTPRDARRIDAIVEYAAQRREEDGLRIETMAETAARVR